MNNLVRFAVAIAFLATVSAAGESPIVEWFDCVSKAEGNYAHPIDCTRFLMCSNGLAYEMDCAPCEYDPVRCPQGRLVFDRVTNMCLYANEATCQSLCDRPGDDKPSSEEEVRSNAFKAGKPL